MSYAEKNLIAGETIQYRARLHWIVLIWHALIGIALSSAGIALLIYWVVPAREGVRHGSGFAWAGLVLFAVAAAIVAAGIVRRNATEIVVTNRRVLIKTGLVSRHTVEMLLSKIESIGVTESPLGRLLGFGTVIVRGTGGTPGPFDRIARPLEFRRQVQGQVEFPPAPPRAT